MAEGAPGEVAVGVGCCVSVPLGVVSEEDGGVFSPSGVVINSGGGVCEAGPVPAAISHVFVSGLHTCPVIGHSLSLLLQHAMPPHSIFSTVSADFANLYSAWAEIR